MLPRLAGSWSVQWIPREANTTADVLVRLAYGNGGAHYMVHATAWRPGCVVRCFSDVGMNSGGMLASGLAAFASYSRGETWNMVFCCCERMGETMRQDDADVVELESLALHKAVNRISQWTLGELGELVVSEEKENTVGRKMMAASCGRMENMWTLNC